MKKRQIIKVIALIIGGLALLFFGMFIFAEGIPDIWNIEDGRLKAMLLLMAFAAFGYFFSFFKPKDGGMVLTFSGVLLGLNMFYHGGVHDIVPALIYSLPLLISGLMLWWVGKGKS
ncbi:MAG: hypothetical protein K8R86_09250 [Bacteroidales bacterium]|nr:hypothetical protein [Bacteroidales bacterium]